MYSLLNTSFLSAKLDLFQQWFQGCALAEPGGPWRLTFVLGRLENLSFFIEIICWAHWISQVQSTGLPSILLRAQPWIWYFLEHQPDQEKISSLKLISSCQLHV